MKLETLNKIERCSVNASGEMITTFPTTDIDWVVYFYVETLKRAAIGEE